MNRRGYLWTIAALAPSVAGCTSVIGSGPEVTGDSPLAVTAPTVERGGADRIELTARSPTSLRVTEDPDVDARLLEYGDAVFSPPPDAVYQSLPPSWVWSSPETVSGEIPVRVPEDVSPGKYRYTLTVRQGDEDSGLSESFTLTVE